MSMNSRRLTGFSCSSTIKIITCILLGISIPVFSRPQNLVFQNSDHDHYNNNNNNNNNGDKSIIFRGLNVPILFGEEAQASDTVIQFAPIEPKGKDKNKATSNSESFFIFPTDEELDAEDELSSSLRPTTSKTDKISYATDSPNKQTMAGLSQSQQIILNPDYLPTGTRFQNTDPNSKNNNNNKSKNKPPVSSQEIQLLDEKLDKFLSWVKTKGLPENFVEATSSSPTQTKNTDQELDIYHLSKGDALECPANKKRGPGGICIATVEYEK